MSKTIYFSLLVLLLLAFSQPVSASNITNDVHVSGNGTSTVKIDNNVNSTVNGVSQNNADCQTDIVMDTNGEHKEYHGNCGNVDLKSGSNSVTVSNGNPSSTSHPASSPTSQSPQPTLSPSPTASSSATPSSTTTPQSGTFDLFEVIKSFFDNLFN